MRLRKKIKIRALLSESHSKAVEIPVKSSFALKEPNFSFPFIKESLLKLAAFCLIVALNWAGLSAVIGTLAYLNDTENSADNSFTAGSLDFQVDLKKEDNRFQTHTQGGWGSRAHGNNPGNYRDDNFDAAFPNGATIGDANGFTALFTDAEAVEDFLPAGGTPMPLGEDYIDPTDTEAGVLAGQTLALTLNVGFDLYDPDFAPSINNLGDYVINDSSVPCNGMTAQEVLDEANTILGGLSGSFSASDINDCATWINEKFEDGGDDDGLSPGGSFSQFATIKNVGSLDFQYTARVEKTSGDDDFCNALNLEALLEGATNYSGDLLDFVSSPVVYSSSADEWEFIISLPEDADAESSCGFDFVFSGWQTNLPSFGGFSDIERADDPIYGITHVSVETYSNAQNSEEPTNEEEPIIEETSTVTVIEETTGEETTVNEEANTEDQTEEEISSEDELIVLEENNETGGETTENVIEEPSAETNGPTDGEATLEEAPVIEEQPVTVLENTIVESAAPETGGGDGTAGGGGGDISE
ncbi:MAG: SipW-dependent-type signal peptide-containing protein [bacterium]|nr:SipW-dependent-type signal peptide-containing protein [bacterium]